ncbi:Serine/threonine-protein kinase-like protein [Drosera capensis]
MGYLSCKAESSTSVKTTHHPKHPIEQNQQHHNQEHEQEHKQEQSHNHNRHQNPIKIQQFQYTDLELATSNFSTQKLLGRGSHGLVYKAVLPSGRLVAVKKPSRRDPSSEFDNELTVLSHLNSPRASFHHP